MNRQCKCGGQMIPYFTYNEKISMIKDLKRKRPGISLKDAKDIVDGFLQKHPKYNQIHSFMCNRCHVIHRQRVRTTDAAKKEWVQI